MEADILHSGFDGLKFSVETDIPSDLRTALAEAKAQAIQTNAETILEFGSVALSVRRTGGSAFSAHTGPSGTFSTRKIALQTIPASPWTFAPSCWRLAGWPPQRNTFAPAWRPSASVMPITFYA